MSQKERRDSVPGNHVVEPARGKKKERLETEATLLLEKADFYHKDFDNFLGIMLKLLGSTRSGKIQSSNLLRDTENHCILQVGLNSTYPEISSKLYIGHTETLEQPKTPYLYEVLSFNNTFRENPLVVRRRIINLPFLEETFPSYTGASILWRPTISSSVTDDFLNDVQVRDVAGKVFNAWKTSPKT